MSTDPRDALDRLVAALEAHLTAASRRRGETDPAVVKAYQTLADAFESYDDSLYGAYDEVTPLVLYDDAEDESDDDETGDDDVPVDEIDLDPVADEGPDDVADDGEYVFEDGSAPTPR